MCIHSLKSESYLSRSRSLPPFLRALSRSSSFFRDFLLGDPLRLLDLDLFLCFRLLLSETEKTRYQNLQKEKAFVNKEILPGTEIKSDDFWERFGKVVHELAPINKALIQKRENIQKESQY